VQVWLLGEPRLAQFVEFGRQSEGRKGRVLRAQGGFEGTLRKIAIWGCAGWASAAAWGQVPSVPAVRAVEPPLVDGELNDAIWQKAAPAGPFVDPFTGKPPADRTEAWIAFDKEAIYVAFRCYDSKPEQIVAREIVPGAQMETDDRVGFHLDPFQSRVEAGISVFQVNAIGTQTERIAGGRTAKREWRGEWQAAVLRGTDSWTAEMRIPWRILNHGGAGARNMALNFSRYQARTDVYSEWSNRGPAERAELHGVWAGVEPPPRQAAKVEGLAYAAPEWNDGRSELRAGLDVRYRFTPSLTGVASLNPDFRNIEGQIAGIDFTRTERFLEDVRPFFTEGGTFFDMTGMFTFGRMFYSRRIEEFDFGAKVFGNPSDRMRIGALATVDGSRRDGAFRVSQILGPRSHVSVFGTGTDRPGLDNTAIGGTFGRYWGNYGFNFQLASASHNGVADSAGAYAFDYSVPRFLTMVRTLWIEPNFRPSLGFIPYTDRKGWYWFTRHENDYRAGPLKRLQAELYVDRFRHYDGSPDEEGYTVGGNVLFRSDHDLSVFVSRFEFEGVPDRTLWVEAGMNRSNRFKRFTVGYETGRRENAETRFLTIQATYRAFGGLDLGLRRSVLDFMGRSEQTIVTLGWEMDPARSLTGRFVDRSGRQNYYLAFRNAGRAGMETFVILGDPNASEFRRRLSVKLVWAF
jgi:hypothetical protein